MKFNVEGKAFQQTLQAVSRVINPKNPISILENFLIRLEGDFIEITGSDSENALMARLAVFNGEGEGVIAVSARRLLEITKEVDNQPLQFSVNEDTKEIKLTFLNGEFNFMGIRGEDYPDIRKMPEDSRIMELPAEMVAKGIENALYAVSSEISRPVMTGIFWDIHPEDITFVASDTHKLVKYVNSLKAPGFTGSFILPSKTAGIIKNLLGKEDAEVRITFDEKGGTFEFGDFLLYTVFLNGNYPNYNRVIPADNPFQIIADRVGMINSMRRVNLFAPKSSNLVVLNLTTEEVSVTAQDLDYGTSAKERLGCEYTGNSMTVGFNGIFMVEILANMTCETVVLSLSDPARPGIYKALTPEEGEDLVVIQMPMQVI